MRLDLQYRTLHQYSAAQDKLKHNPWGRADEDADKSNRMLVWTVGPEATKESQHNFDHCMDLARWGGADYVVIHKNRLQFLGKNLSDKLTTTVKDKAWTQSYLDWLDEYNYGKPNVYNEYSGLAHCLDFSIYRRCLALKEHTGIWQVASGQRLTNRQRIIETLWEHGFATWRGRPYSVAKIRWTGNRDDLIEATKLFDKYCGRTHGSNVAKKLVAVFTSVNRYAAWPGAW